MIRAALIWTAAIGVAAPATAHTVGLSSIEVGLVGKGAVKVQVGLAPKEVAKAFPQLDKNGSGTIEDGELQLASSAAALRGGVTLSANGKPCELTPVTAAIAPGDAALFDFAGTCPLGKLDGIALPWLDAVGAEHRAIVRVTDLSTDKPLGEALLTLERPSASLDVILEGTSAITFLPIGIEHILIGADHLLFLFGLVLLRARRRDILTIVTAFTVAHSITLSAAVLGWMSLSSTLVEAVIALSVAFIGVENLLSPDMKKRWRITFLFGLVHGFGFAGVLGEIGLPQDATFSALLLFNVGVEIGQLLVLALVLPLLALARRWSGYEKKAIPAVSAVIIVVGLFWFFERVGLF